jgi:hypothetical protein
LSEAVFPLRSRARSPRPEIRSFEGAACVISPRADLLITSSKNLADSSIQS